MLDMDALESKYADQTVVPDFPSSGHAYDRCMWDEHMHTGRIFTVESEGIVGISWAWPIAVTLAEGQLHAAETDPRTWGDEPEIAAAVAAAIALARAKGWALASWAD